MITDVDKAKTPEEISGIDFWNENFTYIDDLDCVIIKTFSGGSHLYCQYDKRLEKGKIKKINSPHSINYNLIILS